MWCDVVESGEVRTVSFASGPTALANADSEGATVLSVGSHEVHVGDVTAAAAKRTVRLHGEVERLVLQPKLEIPSL